MYKQVLITFFLFYSLCLCSQHSGSISCSDIIKVPSEQMCRIETEVSELIKQNEQLQSMEGLQTQCVLLFGYEVKNKDGDLKENLEITREKLIDCSFFQDLTPLYYKRSVEKHKKSFFKRKSYNRKSNDMVPVDSVLCFEYMVFDSSNNCVAEADAVLPHLYFVAGIPIYDKTTELYKKILDSDIECVFRVNCIPSTWFGIKDGNIVCIRVMWDNDIYHALVYTMEDFIKRYWDTRTFDFLKFRYGVGRDEQEGIGMPTIKPIKN